MRNIKIASLKQKERKGIMKSCEELYQEAQKDPSYWTAKVTHSFAISLNNMMVKKNVTKTDLAKKVGVSKAYITKVLRGEANFTVETMVKFSMTLGCVIEDIHFLRSHTKGTTFSPQKSSPIAPKKGKKLFPTYSLHNNIGNGTKA